jgi:hypothetical protein
MNYLPPFEPLPFLLMIGALFWIIPVVRGPQS